MKPTDSNQLNDILSRSRPLAFGTDPDLSPWRSVLSSLLSDLELNRSAELYGEGAAPGIYLWDTTEEPPKMKEIQGLEQMDEYSAAALLYHRLSSGERLFFRRIGESSPRELMLPQTGAKKPVEASAPLSARLAEARVRGGLAAGAGNGPNPRQIFWAEPADPPEGPRPSRWNYLLNLFTFNRFFLKNPRSDPAEYDRRMAAHNRWKERQDQWEQDSAARLSKADEAASLAVQLDEIRTAAAAVGEPLTATPEKAREELETARQMHAEKELRASARNCHSLPEQTDRTLRRADAIHSPGQHQPEDMPDRNKYEAFRVNKEDEDLFTAASLCALGMPEVYAASGDMVENTRSRYAQLSESKLAQIVGRDFATSMSIPNVYMAESFMTSRDTYLNGIYIASRRKAKDLVDAYKDNRPQALQQAYLLGLEIYVNNQQYTDWSTANVLSHLALVDKLWQVSQKHPQLLQDIPPQQMAQTQELLSCAQGCSRIYREMRKGVEAQSRLFANEALTLPADPRERKRLLTDLYMGHLLSDALAADCRRREAVQQPLAEIASNRVLETTGDPQQANSAYASVFSQVGMSGLQIKAGRDDQHLARLRFALEQTPEFRRILSLSDEELKTELRKNAKGIVTNSYSPRDALKRIRDKVQETYSSIEQSGEWFVPRSVAQSRDVKAVWSEHKRLGQMIKSRKAAGAAMVQHFSPDGTTDGWEKVLRSLGQDNPLRNLSLDRSAGHNICLGLMLSRGYSLEQILNPDRETCTAMQEASDTIRKSILKGKSADVVNTMYRSMRAVTGLLEQELTELSRNNCTPQELEARYTRLSVLLECAFDLSQESTKSGLRSFLSESQEDQDRDITRLDLLSLLAQSFTRGLEAQHDICGFALGAPDPDTTGTTFMYAVKLGYARDHYLKPALAALQGGQPNSASLIQQYFNELGMFPTSFQDNYQVFNYRERVLTANIGGPNGKLMSRYAYFPLALSLAKGTAPTAKSMDPNNYSLTVEGVIELHDRTQNFVAQARERMQRQADRQQAPAPEQGAPQAGGMGNL